MKADNEGTPSKASKEEDLEQMRSMFSQREHELEVYIIEKEEEIERLKAIIRTLTKSQHLEGSSVRASRRR